MHRRKLLKGAAAMADRARSQLGDVAKVTPLELMRWPGVLKEREPAQGSLAEGARQTLIEALGMLAESRASEGTRIGAMLESRCRQLETLVSDLNDNFGALGYGIVALFVASWGISFLVYRFKRYDQSAAQG